MRDKALPYAFVAGCFALGLLFFAIGGKWSAFPLFGPMAVYFTLKATGAADRSRGGRWLSYAMIATTWVALGYSVFAR